LAKGIDHQQRSFWGMVNEIFFQQLDTAADGSPKSWSGGCKKERFVWFEANSVEMPHFRADVVGSKRGIPDGLLLEVEPTIGTRPTCEIVA
jgi:hypothetical protein